MNFVSNKEKGKQMASLRNLICLIVVLAITSSAVIAMPVEVGTGDNNAGLYIEWSDGYIAEFLVSFAEPNVTGLELFDIVESGTTLTTVRADFGFGIFIDGIMYNGHSDVGYGGGENWWHYWTKEYAGSSWTYSWVGACDRILVNGDCDGWVYGHGIAPASGPTQEMIAALNIKMAISDKKEAEQAIDTASAKEQAATKALNELLNSGKLHDFKPADLQKAKRKIWLATMRQKVAKYALSKSVDELEDALAILTGEGRQHKRPKKQSDDEVELRRVDINGDGVVNSSDFAILSQHWLEEYEIE